LFWHAADADVRVETLDRIEKAKVTGDTATIRRIVNALDKAERGSRRVYWLATSLASPLPSPKSERILTEPR
jgi:predicted transcriptional regulator